MRYIVTVFIAALLACPAVAGIVNGSFETGDFTGWLTDEMRGYASVVPGGTDGSWSAKMTLQGYYVDGPSGAVFGSAMVGVIQEFQVPAGAWCLVFDAWVIGASVGYASVPNPDEPLLSFTNTNPTTFAVPIGGSQGGVYRFGFWGEDTSPGDNCVYLDNARVVVIPEPGAFGLLLTGLVATLTWRRVRRCS